MRAGVVVAVALMTAFVPTAEAALFKTTPVRGNRGYQSWFAAYTLERNNLQLEIGPTADTVRDLGAGVISPFHECVFTTSGCIVDPYHQPSLDTCQYLVVSATCQRHPTWNHGPLIQLNDGDDTIEMSGAGAAVPWIQLGAGRDRVIGGSGRESIEAADGEVDQIDCGPGVDEVEADAIDVVTNCETVRVF
jgi:hypothetical protein